MFVEEIDHSRVIAIDKIRLLKKDCDERRKTVSNKMIHVEDIKASE